MNMHKLFFYSVWAIAFALFSCNNDDDDNGVSALAAPSNLTATAVSSTQVGLAWADNSNGETGFEVQRSTTSGSGYATVAIISEGAVAFTDDNLEAGATYFYRVRAIGEIANSSYTAEVSVSTGEPTAPTGLSATASSHKTVDLSWTDASTGETGFEVQRSTTSGSGYTTLATVAAGETSYTDETAQANTTYFYQVVAVNGAVNSAASNEATVTTAQTPLMGTWTTGTVKDESGNYLAGYSLYTIEFKADGTYTFIDKDGVSETGNWVEESNKVDLSENEDLNTLWFEGETTVHFLQLEKGDAGKGTVDRILSFELVKL